MASGSVQDVTRSCSRSYWPKRVRVAAFLLARGFSDAAEYFENSAVQKAFAAGEPSLAAYFQARQSQIVTEQREGVQAVGLAQISQREEGVTNLMRAFAVQQEAQGHALLGNERTALVKLDEADDILVDCSSPTLATAGELGSFMSHSYIAVQRGTVLLELQRPDRAIDVLESAITKWPEELQHEGSVFVARLARSYAANGEPDRAGALALRALHTASETGSGRALDELSVVSSILASWRGQVIAVDEFLAETDRIRATRAT